MMSKKIRSLTYGVNSWTVTKRQQERFDLLDFRNPEELPCLPVSLALTA
jgi:uncharacterized protein YebE (UPF0316 family)